jgi:DNA-binding transcriptional LysR family regulator
MNLIESMRIFVRIAELKSFRSAAKELGLSNASATRTIAALEARLNVQLLDRSTRSVRLTPSGLNYLTMCRVWLEHLDHLEGAVRHTEDEPGGSLRIVASNALPLSSLTTLVSAFHRRYPNVDLQLAVSERDDDCLDSSYDVALVANVDADEKSLTAHPVWTSPLICVATSHYLAVHGTPRVPQDLCNHSYIALSTETTNARLLFLNSTGQREQVALTPAYTVNSATAVHAGLLANMGFSIVPASSVAEDEQRGELLRLLPGYTVDARDAGAVVVYRSGTEPTPAARAFIACARANIAQEAMWASDVCVTIPDNTLGKCRAVG